ncbi:MAG: decarboxylating 6-phosphogluconate dehydrogenase [Gaiellaceae bacterium]
MKLGMVGLGRMGGGMTERLRKAGHTVQTYDPNIESTAASLEELVAQLEAPRAVWLMIPAGPVTELAFQELLGLLEEDDTIVDGGNSNFRDSVRRGEEAGARNLHFVDAGVSGGIWGLKEGFCLMVGGDDTAVGRLEPVFLALAPEGGYAHVGKGGAGHFVKMVHNGIEYGLMQAYAEGFDLLNASPDFELDLRQVAALWNQGSVVRSWLLQLLEQALTDHPGLVGVRGYVEDSGEGRWTVQEAIDAAVPVPAIALALFARFASRQDESFAAKVNAALRGQFGGHDVLTE